ncbi:anthranilate phosphoribosyltransferase [Acetonema longum]|uniref:Anthranilate phosphoribosyltransferase n=1 Tax=Acetonema longum DSM 6540 TaxID=1009370 RepID=F7NDQ1_9FIRM|nr:anthranilate phosphoribosyltransferase [Acetonema longum]EGO65820.1 anthranilate phosphoribosyltransferase [Acetonema longum DSM 6540]
MLKEYLNLLISGQDLSREQARNSMKIIMSGQASGSQIGSLLTALRLKGENSEEIVGFAEIMRHFSRRTDCGRRDVVDTCGTGGDRKGTFNVSTAAAFVAAGAGATVAKHGNHGVSSTSGSADVLKSLGVNIDLTPEETTQAVSKLGVGFAYAPVFHPAMKYAGPTRRELGFRTVFNLLGPLTNPLGAKRQLMGVYDGSLTGKIAEVLLQLGVDHAMVVYGLDGLDEITTTAPSQISEVKDGQVTTYRIEPKDYGFTLCDPADYQVSTPAESAASIIQLLQGRHGPKRDLVLINAAAALMVAGRSQDIREGIALSQRSIDSGAALGKLEELRQYTCFRRGGTDDAR